MGSNEQALLRTICYSDIFDYPLKKHELWRYWTATSPCSVTFFTHFLQDLPEFVQEKQGYFFLKGREAIVSLRLKRKKISLEKKRKAIRVVRLLRYIPSIYLIGLSGSLALENASVNDDIDLFIITKKNTVWVTRLLILGLLQLLGVRRKRGEKNARDKICINMILDENAIISPKRLRDIYTAHEILHLQVLFSRNYMYEKFLWGNLWIKNFFPHILINNVRVSRKLGKHFSLKSFFWVLLGFIETIAFWLQYQYMQKNLSRETVKKHIAAFHPFDYRSQILSLWKERVKNTQKMYS